MNLTEAKLAGVDEVGRGPLAGPVVAAAVILDPAQPIDGLADSKQLTEKRRQALFQQIKTQALAWCVAQASESEIDRLNILQASLLAMRRAVLGLQQSPCKVLVDGNRCPVLPYPAEAVIKGDSLVPAISAASILAKVVRDEHMIALDEQYPGYDFAAHKGYGTARHLAALRNLGPTPIHRRTFAPVRALLNTSEQLSIL